jgi:hypothetical protein
MYKYGSKHFPIIPWKGESLDFAGICEGLSSSVFSIFASNGLGDCPSDSELSNALVDCGT